jgi:preprotein translocase subunit SecY
LILLTACHRVVATVLAIVYVQQGRRNAPIMYAKDQIFYAIQRGNQ